MAPQGDTPGTSTGGEIVADESSKPPEPDKSEGRGVATMAKEAHAKKPSDVRDKEWRRHRLAAGHMVIVRSHFKSIRFRRAVDS